MALKLNNRNNGLLFSVVNFVLLLLVLILLSKGAQAHHWFQESHDIETLVTIEVEVINHRFINPHPFFSARLLDSLDADMLKYGDENKVWQLQMDNRGELKELGFNTDTLSPGDKVIVTAHPGSIKKNILYVKALEHPRLGFRYEHNVRQLYKLP